LNDDCATCAQMLVYGRLYTTAPVASDFSDTFSQVKTQGSRQTEGPRLILFVS
jgi:hypothetical protein